MPAEKDIHINTIGGRRSGKSGSRDKGIHITRTASAVTRSVDDDVIAGLKTKTQRAEGTYVGRRLAADGRSVELDLIE